MMELKEIYFLNIIVIKIRIVQHISCFRKILVYVMNTYKTLWASKWMLSYDYLWWIVVYHYIYCDEITNKTYKSFG